MRPTRLDPTLALVSRAVACLAVLGSTSGCYESFTRPLDLLRTDGGRPIDAAALEGGVPIEVSPDGSVRAAPHDAATDERCLGEEVAAYEGPGCAPETRACLETCADADCAAGCYAADPACQRCDDQTLVRCANELGCQTAWDGFACCTDWMCAEGPVGLDRLTCVMETGVCALELESYAACLSGELLRACEARLAECGG